MASNIPRLGELNKRVIINNRADTESGDYSALNTNTEVQKVWAKIVNVSGVKQVDGRNAGAEASHQITIRFRKDVSKQTQLLYQDATGDNYRYMIHTIQHLGNDGNRFITLDCQQMEKENTYDNPSPEDGDIVSGQYALVFDSTESTGSYLNLGTIDDVVQASYTLEYFIDVTATTLEAVWSSMGTISAENKTGLIESQYSTGTKLAWWYAYNGRQESFVYPTDGYFKVADVYDSDAATRKLFVDGVLIYSQSTAILPTSGDVTFGNSGAVRVNPLSAKLSAPAIYSYAKDDETIESEGERMPTIDDDNIVFMGIVTPEGETASSASTSAESNGIYDAVGGAYSYNLGSGDLGTEELT